MNSADAQVINMVNAPHEKREAARKANAEKAAARKFVRRLVLWAAAAQLMAAATVCGWMAAWFGIVSVLSCIAAGVADLNECLGEIS